MRFASLQFRFAEWQSFAKIRFDFLKELFKKRLGSKFRVAFLLFAASVRKSAPAANGCCGGRCTAAKGDMVDCARGRETRSGGEGCYGSRCTAAKGDMVDCARGRETRSGGKGGYGGRSCVIEVCARLAGVFLRGIGCEFFEVVRGKWGAPLKIFIFY